MSRLRSFFGSGLLLALFGLPFFGVGAGMSVWQWRDVLRGREIRSSWEPVPARIESAELETGRGSKGGRTRRAVGAYSYRYQGRDYSSEELALQSGSDNIGAFHVRLHREMRAAKNAGRPLTAYVNPADPTEAVLRPEWRVELGLFKALFGVVFGGVGALLFICSGYAFVEDRRWSRRRAAHPAKPWLWREDWAAGRVFPMHGPKAVVVFALFVMLNASTLPLWGALPGVWAGGGGFRWLLGSALGLVALGDFFCVRSLVRVWRHRGVMVEITTMPLPPGEQIRLGVRAPNGLPAGGGLRATLKCVRHFTTGAGKKRRVDRDTRWEKTEMIAGPFFQGHPIEIVFDPPAGLPSVTPESGSDDRYAWELHLEARGPGPDLVEEFELPVFRKK